MTNIPPKPQTCNGDIAHLPAALEHLRELPIWVGWKWFWNGKKWTKPPYRVDAPGVHASSGDPETWGTYEVALQRVKDGALDGFGIAVQGSKIAGIDLDDCYDRETGLIEPWALDYVEQFPGAYVEATVSGTGLRILGRAENGVSLSPKFKLPEHGERAGIELFLNSTHYLTLSCNQIGQCAELPPISDGMRQIAEELGRTGQTNGKGFDFNGEHATVAPDGAEAPGAETPPQSENSTPWSYAEEARLRSALAAIPANEQALSEKLGHSHDAWVRMARAIERLGWDERGYNILRDWCSQSAEFNERGLRTQWSSFARNRNHADPVTIGTVYYYAQQFGWREQDRHVEGAGSLIEPIMRLKDWLERPLGEPDFALGNILTTTSRGLLWAPTGIGKTMFGISTALRMAAGSQWLAWQAVRPLRVLYVDGEMSQRLLKQRLVDEVRRSGLCPDTLHVLSHEDIADFQPLNTPAGQQQIERHIAHIGGVDFEVVPVV
jgi:AAA domain/Primase C terminal 2 (PriCT-2)